MSLARTSARLSSPETASISPTQAVPRRKYRRTWAVKLTLLLDGRTSASQPRAHSVRCKSSSVASPGLPARRHRRRCHCISSPNESRSDTCPRRSMITNLRRYGAPARAADGGPSMGHHPRGTTSPRQVAPKRTGVNAHQDEDVRAAILSSVVVSDDSKLRYVQTKVVVSKLLNE